MNINPKTEVYDGDYQIIFSDSFNVYENKLRITDIAGYTFELIFDEGKFSAGESGIFVEPDNNNKRATITMKKFRNQLGAGSTEKLTVIDLEDGRKIFFSIYGSALSAETNILHITINFYIK